MLRILLSIYCIDIYPKYGYALNIETLDKPRVIDYFPK